MNSVRDNSFSLIFYTNKLPIHPKFSAPSRRFPQSQNLIYVFRIARITVLKYPPQLFYFFLYRYPDCSIRTSKIEPGCINFWVQDLFSCVGWGKGDRVGPRVRGV